MLYRNCQHQKISFSTETKWTSFEVTTPLRRQDRLRCHNIIKYAVNTL